MIEVESIPNAYKTFEALRSLGYDLNSSVADLIDNSIAAEVSSKNIQIKLELDEDNNAFFLIKDDGSGMTESILEESMRIGADADYSNNDLGKFGMGMKTATLSHCDKLTVISKTGVSQ